MCAGCAMTAMAGASGARAWLAQRGWTWLTPGRMRAATSTLFLVASAIATVRLS